MRKGRDRPTKRDLMLLGKELGYSSAREVLDVLKRNGVKGHYDPEKYGEYVAILTAHARTLESILGKLNQEGAKASKSGLGAKDLPAHAVRAMKRMAERPWLFPPVAKDSKGNYRKMQDREDLKDGEEMVYEGVLKEEHLKAVDEAREKEKKDAVGTGKSPPGQQ